MFRIAFYKGKGNLFNGFVRFWDGGKYSHSELVFSDGMSASASWRDGRQVRGKYIDFNPEHWDFVDVPAHMESRARHFFAVTKSAPYDLAGQVRFAIAPLRGSREGYWCSEWVAEALGMPDPWRYGPNGLYAALTWSGATNCVITP